MKNIMTKLSMLLCAALGVVSCENAAVDEQVELSQEGNLISGTYRITSNLGADTKVSVDDNAKLSWEIDDKLYIFESVDADATTPTEYLTFEIDPESISEDGKSAEFVGEGLYAETNYFAIVGSESQMPWYVSSMDMYMWGFEANSFTTLSNSYFILSEVFEPSTTTTSILTFTNEFSIFEFTIALDESFADVEYQISTLNIQNDSSNFSSWLFIDPTTGTGAFNLNDTPNDSSNIFISGSSSDYMTLSSTPSTIKLTAFCDSSIDPQDEVFYMTMTSLDGDAGFEYSIPATQVENGKYYTMDITLSQDNFVDLAAIDGDRSVLIDLYNSTSGSNWTYNSCWGEESISLNNWFGVVTDDDGRVTELYLSGNNLSGTLPESLGNLSNLKLLDLSNNNLSGDLPESLLALENLESVYVYMTDIEGDVLQELIDDPDVNVAWEDTWYDASLTQAYIDDKYAYAFYEYLRDGASTDALDPSYTSSASTPGSYSDVASDNITTAGLLANLASDTYTTADDLGWDIFYLINYANVIIQEATISTAFTDAQQADFIAQGRFIRGLAYFKSALRYGGAILLDSPLTIGDEWINMPRNTIKETYDFIIADFLAAAEDLTGTSVTKFNSASAYAFAAEAALQAASYVGDDNYYQDALGYSESAMTNTTATLDSNYYNIFNDFGNAGSNSEIMLAWDRDETKGRHIQSSSYRMNVYVNASAYTTSSLAFPYALSWTSAAQNFGGGTQSMINEYEVINPDGTASKWDESYYYNDYIAGGSTRAYEVLVEHRDARMYASFVTDSSTYGPYDDIVCTRAYGNISRDNSTNGTTMRCSTYPIRKNCHDKEACAWGTYSAYHQVIMRLGRVYLNYAEALLKTGNTALALEYVNKTRTTHGQLPALSTSLSADDAWAAYCSERRVDLFYECNDRYWSLLRWAYSGDTAAWTCLNDDIDKYYQLSADGNTFSEQTLPASVVATGDHIFTVRRYLYPIPQTVIDDSNGVIVQNPNW